MLLDHGNKHILVYCSTNNTDGKCRSNFCIQTMDILKASWCVCVYVTKFEDVSRTGKFDYVLIIQVPKVSFVQPFSENIP